MRDLSLHMMDIIQNSVSAGARNIGVFICADKVRDLLSVEISDDGCGMDQDFLSKVTDPFTTTRTTRKVGLGLPLLEEACKTAGGRLLLRSVQGAGTWIVAEMAISNIDRLPLGDLGDTFFVLLMNQDGIRYILDLEADGRTYRLDIPAARQERAERGDNEFDSAIYIRELIEKSKKRIFGGILNEIVG
ncbi:MAG: ATP-binding protein [Saccharofermentanales bacterium]